MITHVKHVVIPVTDQDRALRFYTEKLGCKLVCDVPVPGGSQRWIELEIPGAQTQVVLFTPEGQEKNIGTSSPVIFTADDIHATYRELLEKGVHFSLPPKEETWGTYALFQDPDKNEFCLSSS